MSKSKAKSASIQSLARSARWRDAEHHSHEVQFCADDASFLDTLSQFIGTALSTGDAAIVIATEAHRDGLAERLKAHSVDTASAFEQGRYVLLDAAETLSKIMVEGWPDPAQFSEFIGGIITRASEAANVEDSQVVIFGEMVSLLWAEEKAEATIRLEQLWNDLAKTHSFRLLCGYPMKGFLREEHGESFLNICREHSGVIPTENCTALINKEKHLRSITRSQQKARELKSTVELHQSEERFRLLVEGVQDYAIFMLDSQGHITSWNSGAERIKGYQSSEIIGNHFSCFYPEEDIRSGRPQRQLEKAAKEGRCEDEGWRLRKDGSRFWANVVITSLRDNEGNVIGFSKVTRDSTERRQAEEATRELSWRLLRLQDEERQKISRDLHDGTGSLLSAVLMNLAIVQDDATFLSERGSGALREAAEWAHQCVSEIRTMSYLLHPPLLTEAGLLPALRWFVEGYSKRSGIQATLEAPAELSRLADNIEISLFRIVQEALTNIHRHTKSTIAKVRVLLEGQLLKVEVIDNGGGFPPGILEGVGLKGMRERMTEMGGQLEIASTVTGTTVRALASLKGNDESVHLSADGDASSERTLNKNTSLRDVSPPIKKFRILVADDHGIVRQGIARILEGEQDFEMCGEASDGSKAIYEANRLTPDIIIMDLCMPKMDGLEATRRILKEHPEIAVLILTIDESEQMVREVAKSGARAYMGKADAGANLIAMLKSLTRPATRSAAKHT